MSDSEYFISRERSNGLLKFRNKKHETCPVNIGGAVKQIVYADGYRINRGLLLRDTGLEQSIWFPQFVSRKNKVASRPGRLWASVWCATHRALKDMRIFEWWAPAYKYRVCGGVPDVFDGDTRNNEDSFIVLKHCYGFDVQRRRRL
jgi:hypothetical protein